TFTFTSIARSPLEYLENLLHLHLIYFSLVRMVIKALPASVFKAGQKDFYAAWYVLPAGVLTSAVLMAKKVMEAGLEKVRDPSEASTRGRRMKLQFIKVAIDALAQITGAID